MATTPWRLQVQQHVEAEVCMPLTSFGLVRGCQFNLSCIGLVSPVPKRLSRAPLIRRCAYTGAVDAAKRLLQSCFGNDSTVETVLCLSGTVVETDEA